MSWTSEPLSVPVGEPSAEAGPLGGLTRVDLQFFGVNHTNSSYEVRVFLDNPQADGATDVADPAAAAAAGYAGSYYVFGHGGCAGSDPGHCEAPTSGPSRYDLRRPFKLRGQTRVVTVTDAVERAVSGRGVRAEAPSLSVTCVGVGAADADDGPELLAFDRVALVAYE